jgi:hypothetical protein
MQGTEIDRDEEVRQLAYRFWQEAGCPNESELQHWLKAEATWLQERSPKNESNPSKSRKGRKPRQTRTVKREL